MRGPSDHQPLLEFTASNATLDRYKEIIDPDGWRLENYLRNPVFLNSHNYGDIIYTIGKAVRTEVRDGALCQQIQFATEANPLARIAYGLYRGGFLNAVSVGFIPIRWENGPRDSDCRREYLEQELIEVSAVTVPANPDALQLALKTGAITKPDLHEAAEMLTCYVRTLSSDSVYQPSTINHQPFLTIARRLHQAMRA